MPDMLPHAIDVALTQLDVREATGQNDGIPATRYNRGDCLPWCAAFCLWCNEQSGMDARVVVNPPDYWMFRAVAQFELAMKRRGWWAAASSTPARNDFVFFANRGASDAHPAGRHMGIVEGLSGHLLATVEGNWQNRVARLVHDLSRPAVRDRITGFARVPRRPGLPVD